MCQITQEVEIFKQEYLKKGLAMYFIKFIIVANTVILFIKILPFAFKKSRKKWSF